MEGLSKQPGWVVHCVFDDKESPNHANAHTHGLRALFDHPELQICLPVPPEVLHGIFWAVHDQVLAKGQKLEAGRVYRTFLQNGVPVAVVNASSTDNESVLRLIIADPALHAHKGLMQAGPYAQQYEGSRPPFPEAH